LFAQIQLVTQLRGIHRKFQTDRLNGMGLIHDGREERNDNGHPLVTFLNTFFPNIDPAGQVNMISFMNAFPSNAMPVTGWQVRIAVSMPGALEAAAVADVNTMIIQHDMNPSRCDVTARGVFGGERRGYFLEPGGSFESDVGTLFSLSGLLASMESGDALVFTAVPPDSGRRMGVDQDTDCLNDGLDPKPQHDDFGDADFDGGVHLNDFLLMVPCYALDGSVNPLPFECRVFDAGCDGLLDETDADAFISAYEDALLDCNANGEPDLLDILLGGSPDQNSDGVPDECQTLPLAEAAGSRYISVTPTGVEAVAILVTSPQFDCLSKFSDERGFLTDDPVFLTPGEWGTVHIGDIEIVPEGDYTVQLDNGVFLSAGTTVRTHDFGNPDGNTVVNIFDLFCVLDAFATDYDADCTLQSADLMPEKPNRVINIFDLFAVLDTFAGEPYPGPQPCE